MRVYAYTCTARRRGRGLAVLHTDSLDLIEEWKGTFKAKDRPTFNTKINRKRSQ